MNQVDKLIEEFYKKKKFFEKHWSLLLVYGILVGLLTVLIVKILKRLP